MNQWEIVGAVLSAVLVIAGVIFYFTKPLVFVFNRIEKATAETRILIKEFSTVVSDLSSTVRLLSYQREADKVMFEKALIRIDELQDSIQQIEINCAKQLKRGER